MKYEKIAEFTNTTKASKSKIYRFYKKNEELFLETKKQMENECFQWTTKGISIVK